MKSPRHDGVKINIIKEKAERIGDITGGYWRHLRKNALKRGIEFTITVDEAWGIFVEQNGKCALSGEQIFFSENWRHEEQTASLDRISYSNSYNVRNVRWVHKDIERIKGSFSDDVLLEWCRRMHLYRYKMSDRPSFDEYFMMLAFDVSTRSEDLHIKQGAIITDINSNHILGTGYNATIRGSDKGVINLSDREFRRPWMIHAEENAMMNCQKHPLELPKGAAIYITGMPCINCIQRLVNFGIKKIYVADRCGTSTDDDTTNLMRQQIIKMADLDVRLMPINNVWIKRVLL